MLHDNALHHSSYCRTKTYQAGNQLFFTAGRVPIPPKGSRAPKMNPSSAIQQKKNFLQTKQRFRLLLNYNFTSCDYVVVLSYDNKHLPDNIGQAFEDAKNYLRRLNHWRCAHGLPKASYLYLVENRTREGKEARFHIHLVLSGDMPKAVVKQLWKNGRVERIDFLEISADCGANGLARYLQKIHNAANGRPGKWNYRRSADLRLPEPTISTDMTHRQTEFFARNEQSLIEYLENKDPACRVEEAIGIFRDTFPGAYLYAQMSGRTSSSYAYAPLAAQRALKGCPTDEELSAAAIRVMEERRAYQCDIINSLVHKPYQKNFISGGFGNFKKESEVSSLVVDRISQNLIPKTTCYRPDCA